MTHIRIETSETTTVRLEHHVAAANADEAAQWIAHADIVRVLQVERTTTVHHETAAPARELPWQASDIVEAVRHLMAGDDPFTVHVLLRTMKDTIEIAVVSIDEDVLVGQIFPSTSDVNMTIPLSDIVSMRIEA